MPLLTMASAMDWISVSLTSQPNLFQLFQPMGGVSARLSSAPRALAGTNTERKTIVNRRKKRGLFIRTPKILSLGHTGNNYGETFCVNALSSGESDPQTQFPGLPTPHGIDRQLHRLTTHLCRMASGFQRFRFFALRPARNVPANHFARDNCRRYGFLRSASFRPLRFSFGHLVRDGCSWYRQVRN